MSGINQLMLKQLGQGVQAENAGLKTSSSRNQSEMSFHSMLNTQMNSTQVKQQVNRESQLKTNHTETRHDTHSQSESSNSEHTVKDNQQAQSQNQSQAKQDSTDNSQTQSQQGTDSTQKIAEKVKEAVAKTPEYTDIKQVIEQVLTENNIQASDIDLDSLIADLKSALEDLNINVEALTDLVQKVETVFADITGQISQQLAQLDPNKGLQNVGDEEVATDDSLINVDSQGKSKTDSSLMKLEQSTDKMLSNSDQQDQKHTIDKTISAQNKAIDDFEKSAITKFDKDINADLNLNKNQIQNSNQHQVQNQNSNQNQVQQNLMGTLSNLNELNHVQTKLAKAEQMSIPGKLGTAEFKQGLSEKVVFMMKGDMNSAAIKLNPSELGPIEIKLNINHNKQADITILTQHGLVKDSVEQAMPRLREMLADSGIQLNNVNVSDQSLKQNQQQAQQDGDQGHKNGVSSLYQEVFGDKDASDEEVMSKIMMHRHRTDGLVDYYA